MDAIFKDGANGFNHFKNCTFYDIHTGDVLEHADDGGEMWIENSHFKQIGTKIPFYQDANETFADHPALDAELTDWERILYKS